MKCHVHVLIASITSGFISACPSCSLCLCRSFRSVCAHSIYLQRLPRILVRHTARGVDSCFPTFLFRHFIDVLLILMMMIKGQLTIRYVLLHSIQNLRLLHQRQWPQLLRCIVLRSYQYGFLLCALSPLWLCLIDYFMLMGIIMVVSVLSCQRTCTDWICFLSHRRRLSVAVRLNYLIYLGKWHQRRLHDTFWFLSY